jgi:hypothetical protein
MTTDLEDRMRESLRTEAERAPLPAPEWQGATYIAADDSPHHRSRWLLVATAAAALTAVGVLAATRPGGDTRPVAPVRPPFLHGDEVPAMPVDVPARFQPNGIVKPGSVRAVKVPGQPGVSVVYVTGFLSPESAEYQCADLVETDGGAGGGCTPLGSLAYSVGGETDSTAQTWYALTWSRLPDETAYVQLVDADGRSWWQAPTAGVAIFPNPGARAPRSLTAFDLAGHVLVSAGSNDPVQTSAALLVPDFVAHGNDWTPLLLDVGFARLPDCLSAAGGTDIHAQLGPTFPPGTDVDAVWQRCIDYTAAAVVAKAAELRGG